AEKIANVQGEAAASAQIDMVRVYINDTADNMAKWGKDAISSFAEGDELKMMVLGLKRFTKTDIYNSKDARRRIAKVIIDENKYPW
nr:acyl-CoA dehydrogenase [Flavobacteriales bacterium]